MHLHNACLVAATRGVLQKKVFLEISQNSQENTCAWVSFLRTFFAEHLWTTASQNTKTTFPAGTATLWQRCHNVVVDVVTTLWHGRKWELCQRRFPTLWQRRSPTLSRRCHNVLQRRHNSQHWISRPFYYRLFWFLSLQRNMRELSGKWY